MDQLPNVLNRPCRLDDVLAAGVSMHRLRRWLRDGVVRRVCRGVYINASIEDTVDVRIAALGLVVPDDAVVSDRTAGWLHGAASDRHPADRGRRHRHQAVQPGLGILVVIKVAVVLFVVVAGLLFVKAANYAGRPGLQHGSARGRKRTEDPAAEADHRQPDPVRVMGIVADASIVFFAFIGFDIVATCAEEARDPKKDLPRGITAP